MTTLKLQEWKNRNARVQVQHFRYSLKKNAIVPLHYFRLSKTQSDIGPKGGMTFVNVRTAEGQNYFGIAECCMKDAYRNKLGVSLALKRLQIT